MIAQAYKEMLGAKSVIREISEWSTARGAEIGYDNVFDYSLGNPSVACPASFTAACRDLLEHTDPVALHGYTPTLTLPEVRAAVAESLNRRFGMDYTAAHIFMTSGAAVPYPAQFYDDTLTCYSFSKSLSVPGERIGYLAANPRCEDADLIVPMCGQISRGTGHNCPSGLFQRAVARCLDDTSDLSVYETNMELLYAELKRLGFTVQKPDGTFYIFPKALEADANAFCRKAMRYDLALVPGDTFGCPGYFRMAYCIETEKVRRSFAALERFVREEYGVENEK